MMDGVYPTEKQLDEHLRDVQAGDSDPHNDDESWDKYGDGELYDPNYPTPAELPVDAQALLYDRYLEEALFELRFVAAEIVERGELKYPPPVEDTLELANGVYEERYANSGLPRTELTDFLVAALIECLEDRHVELDDETVESYMRTVHDSALASDRELATIRQ